MTKQDRAILDASVEYYEAHEGYRAHPSLVTARALGRAQSRLKALKRQRPRTPRTAKKVSGDL